MSGAVRQLAQVGARLGESPVWLPDRRVWLWLDLQGRAVHRFDPATGADRVIAEGFAEDLACLVRWTEGAALLVSVRGFHRLAIDSGEVSPLPCPVPLPEGTIFNDGKADRHGALWIGSSDAAEAAPLGRLWRLRRGEVTEVAAGFAVSNGPAFTPGADAAYFADTFGRRILRFALDGAGAPVGQAVFAEIAEGEGFPDGMTTDAAGILHVGHWDGARISRWTPQGAALTPVGLPARNVTALAFGGEDLRSVLVTTAALFPGQTDAPEGGGHGDLYGFRAETPGLPEPALAPDLLG